MTREQFTVTGRDGAEVMFSRCRWCKFTRGRLDVVEAHERLAHMPALVALEAEQAIRQQTAALDSLARTPAAEVSEEQS